MAITRDRRRTIKLDQKTMAAQLVSKYGGRRQAARGAAEQEHRAEPRHGRRWTRRTPTLTSSGMHAVTPSSRKKKSCYIVCLRSSVDLSRHPGGPRQLHNPGTLINDMGSPRHLDKACRRPARRCTRPLPVYSTGLRRNRGSFYAASWTITSLFGMADMDLWRAQLERLGHLCGSGGSASHLMCEGRGDGTRWRRCRACPD